MQKQAEKRNEWKQGNGLYLVVKHVQDLRFLNIFTNLQHLLDARSELLSGPKRLDSVFYICYNYDYI